MKPVKRTRFRIYLGTVFYTGKRYLQWWFGKQRYSKTRDTTPWPFVGARHRTPLFRKLQSVDMWLQHNKVINLQLAISKLDGIILYPGEVFSFWKRIGRPSRRKGYVEGMTLFYGSFRPGVGGGLCQLTNLIYWMTLHTPLEVIERHRHSYDVFPDSERTQPFGSGATCSYNYLDLRIYNPTEEHYQLKLYMTDEALIGEWRTTSAQRKKFEVYEKEHKITQEYWGGYVRHNTIFRRVWNEHHELLDDHFVTENHALMMYQPFLKNGE